MSDITINGKDVDAQLLENLNSNINALHKTIEENNSIASNQNNLLLRYNKRLLWLTVAISIIALAQLWGIFIK